MLTSFPRLRPELDHLNSCTPYIILTPSKVSAAVSGKVGPDPIDAKKASGSIVHLIEGSSSVVFHLTPLYSTIH